MNKKLINTCLRIYNRSESSYKRVKMMAFLIDGNRILDYGINSNDTDPIQTKYGLIYGRRIDNIFNQYKRHAEIDCLKKYIENKEVDMSKLCLFILSLKDDGTFRCSKPCPICQEFLNSIGIGKICYINEYGRFVEEKNI